MLHSCQCMGVHLLCSFEVTTQVPLVFYTVRGLERPGNLMWCVPSRSPRLRVDRDNEMTLDAVKGHADKCRKHCRGQAKAHYNPFQGGDQPKPREALTVELTLKDEYVFY